MQKIKYSKSTGYALIEAILAISLVSAAQLFRASMDYEQEQFAIATDLGKDLGGVLYAIDKRVLLDGRVLTSVDASTGVTVKGDWNETWPDTESFFDGMIGKELVGKDNPVCGDSATGWEPKVSENSRLALVNCYEINKNNPPFNFEFEGRRTGAVGDDHILGEWSFIAYHSSDDEFYDNFKYYSYVKNKAELYDSLKMTGQHQVSYVDRSDSTLSEFSTVADCWSAGSNCAIQFKYRTSQVGESMQSSYMEIDGSTPLVGSLRFRTDAAQPEKCYKHDTSNNVESVDCGLEFDLATGNLGARVNSATSSRYDLMLESSSGAPIVTLCTDMNGVEEATPCGISVVDDGGSALASAYMDQIFSESLKTNELEVLDKITIRKTLVEGAVGYDDTLEVGLSGLYRNDSTGLMKVGFDSDGISIEANNRSIDVAAKEINLTSEDSATFAAKDLVLQSDNARLLDSNATVSLLHSDYGDPTNSKIATQAFSLDGVKVVAMDFVASGTRVDKRSCPSTETGNKPDLQWTTYPASGFNSNIKAVGDTCNTLDPDFLKVSAKSTLNVVGYSGLSQVTHIKTDYTGSVACDPARDTSVTYEVIDDGKLKPVYTFWGGSKGQVFNGVNMMLIQYCDYGAN